MGLGLVKEVDVCWPPLYALPVLLGPYRGSLTLIHWGGVVRVLLSVRRREIDSLFISVLAEYCGILASICCPSGIWVFITYACV